MYIYVFQYGNLAEVLFHMRQHELKGISGNVKGNRLHVIET